MPRVLNKRLQAVALNGVYVGRPSPWGNPFSMHEESGRDAACDRFEAYATKRHAEDPTWLAPLRGKDLVCWCAPRRCHADTLLRLANEPPTTSPQEGSS